MRLVIATALLVALLPSSLAWGEGSITVQPGGLLIQDVIPGELYDLAQAMGVPLTVLNGDAQPHTFLLSAHRPSEVGSGRWLEGYEEIPDPQWLALEPTALRVEPNSAGHARVTLRVPPGDAHYNRHWSAGIAVRIAPEPGQTLAVALYPRFQIETQGREDLPGLSQDMPALMPSIARLEPVRDAPSQVAGTLLLANRAAKTQTYRLAVQALSLDSQRERIEPSRGYAIMRDVAWLRVEPAVLTLEAGAVAPLTITGRVPELMGRNEECLIFVRSDSGAVHFGRVRLEGTR